MLALTVDGMAEAIPWPHGKRFAFTVFDDTDSATLENVSPVYALLRDLGFRTTKSVGRSPVIGARRFCPAIRVPTPTIVSGCCQSTIKGSRSRCTTPRITRRPARRRSAGWMSSSGSSDATPFVARATAGTRRGCTGARPDCRGLRGAVYPPDPVQALAALARPLERRSAVLGRRMQAKDQVPPQLRLLGDQHAGGVPVDALSRSGPPLREPLVRGHGRRPRRALQRGADRGEPGSPRGVGRGVRHVHPFRRRVLRGRRHRTASSGSRWSGWRRRTGGLCPSPN